MAKTKKANSFKDLNPRRGRLSNKEKEIIEKYVGQKDDVAIAQMLNRTEESVRNYRINELRREVPDDMVNEVEIKYELKQRPFWADLKVQFTPKELDLIVYHWVQLIQQFKGDVLASEEFQILDLIKLQIMISRNLYDKAMASQLIDKTNKLVNDIFDKARGRELTDEETKNIAHLQANLNAAQASQNQRTAEHMKLIEKTQLLFKDLKATREKRFDKIEKAGTNFFAWMKAMDDVVKREEEGHELMLVQESTKKAIKQLSELHTYVTGEVDQPFLTPDTVQDYE